MTKSAASSSRIVTFLFENSVFLMAGTLFALFAAYWNEDLHRQWVHWQPLTLLTGEQAHGAHGHAIDIHFLVNDVLMALFFAIAAKEVWESFLPGGALSNPRKALTPILATAGGVLMPAAIYATGAVLLGRWADLGRGWAIPCATDIAFSYLVAKIIFGKGHPAIAFLLLLAIADDAAGLVILAAFYPAGDMHLIWLLLTVAAIVAAVVMHKSFSLHHWGWYAIPGLASWTSFYMAGVHPALGLIPIIPCLPHAHTDLGIFATKELGRKDTLSEFEHAWKNPVEIFLCLFGFVNAGIAFSSLGAGTWLVLAGLVIGKPLGIVAFTWLAVKVLRLEMPGGLDFRYVTVLGAVAGIGFTVALFVSTAAFPVAGPIQDSVKMGSLMSFVAAAVAFGSAWALGIKPVREPAAEPAIAPLLAEAEA